MVEVFEIEHLVSNWLEEGHLQLKNDKSSYGLTANGIWLLNELIQQIYIK